jgi:hypothetical protein
MPGPWDADPVKARFIAATEEEGQVFGGCVGPVVLVAALLLAATVVLLPVALKVFRAWRQLRQARADLAESRRFAEAAVPVMAYPLMVHRSLRSPGNEPAAGLVIVSFDPAGESLQFMSDLALAISSGGSPDWAPADRAFCGALMGDEQYVPFRRRQIPVSATGGPVVYACDLSISPLLLPGRHVSNEMPLLPCMAEPGPSGRICQVPYWLITGDAAPGEEARRAFGIMLLALAGLARMAEGKRPMPGM